MGKCQHVWAKETLGGDTRWRGIGCGVRKFCVVCGSYRQSALAREASESMLAAQTYFDIVGDKLQCMGLELILSIPKSESKRLDDLMWTDIIAWGKEENSFIHLGEKYVKRHFGAGCGASVALHLTGESDPCEANYHLTFSIFPAVIDGNSFKVLDRWQDVKRLRASWTGMVNDHFGLDLANADLFVKYLDTAARVRHVLAYAFRHPLDDLWKGWHGLDGDVVHYTYGHGKRKDLPADGVLKALERIDLLPAHFKRIRWFGIFSDGQRTKTMESLWLNPEVVEDNEQEWQAEYYAHRVCYEDGGMRLRICLTGEEIFVSDRQLDYRPKGVSIGRRKRWREPGWRLPLVGG